MMTSPNGNIFRVTGPMCGEFTDDRWFPLQRPVTRGLDVCFDLSLNKRLGKKSRRRWFETPSHSLWRHFNALPPSTCWPWLQDNTPVNYEIMDPVDCCNIHEGYTFWTHLKPESHEISFIQNIHCISPSVVIFHRTLKKNTEQGAWFRNHDKRVMAEHAFVKLVFNTSFACLPANVTGKWHRQNGGMTQLPLFRVRSWNNGMHSVSFYILMHVPFHRISLCRWNYIFMHKSQCWLY